MFASRIAYEPRWGRGGSLWVLVEEFFFASGSDRINQSNLQLVLSFGRPGEANVSASLNKTHARAVALPLAGRLAAVLECDVVAGAVPARAQSFRMVRRAARLSARCRDARFFI